MDSIQALKFFFLAFFSQFHNVAYITEMVLHISNLSLRYSTYVIFSGIHFQRLGAWIIAPSLRTHTFDGCRKVAQVEAGLRQLHFSAVSATKPKSERKCHWEYFRLGNQTMKTRWKTYTNASTRNSRANRVARTGYMAHCVYVTNPLWFALDLLASFPGKK